MKKFSLLLLAAACLSARAETYSLGAHGRLSVYLDKAWKVTGEDMADHYEITVEPRGNVNASCKITVLYPEDDRLDTKAKLRDRVLEVCQQFTEGSVERKAVAKEFYLKRGFGYYCNFTDPELVGKPPEPGNYKVMSSGMIRLAKDVVIGVTIFADSFKSEEYQQLLGAVEGLELGAAISDRPI